jgi:MerR family transcriptional regulator/heat shock protein HspR
VKIGTQFERIFQTIGFVILRIEFLMRQLIDIEEPQVPIGIVAKKFNISVHTLRLYEAEGLILPYKTKTKRRYYSQADMERIACIRQMITEKGLNIAGIKSLLAMVPCWELLPCSEAERIGCEAYSNMSEPCWTIKVKSDFCKSEACRTCHVYKSLAGCHNIKEYLKANWK